MTTFAQTSPATGFSGWLHRAEAWLDNKGKAAWIIAIVVAFILFWPLGLALLAYMFWSRKMSRLSNGLSCSRRAQRHNHMSRPTGNAAFDAYKTETLRRLEEEQENFEAFLQRLRDARDKAEFDQFMDERAKPAATEDGDEKDA
ncbi:DUF2852 domain-containing protein [uncultured Roseovarius sp.]|uniref:DUF2852 domain-containing protein n=1 Tax=uncultured Roseovarius sp. TaxID=293344 RepID=UPI0026281118|nr:DUF2852 domain-containing protein [uncultured Roseovarius sp.]